MRMWPRIAITWLALFALGTAHAQEGRAQDREAKPAKRAKKSSASAYDLQAAVKAKREGKSAAEAASAETGEPPPIDVKLATELRAKIASCYQAETGNPLAPADRALVEEYSDSLVRELERGYRSTTCASDAPAGEQCLSKLKLLSCDELAEGIRDRRWDKHILPDERAAVTRFTQALVQKKNQCAKERGAEVDLIQQEIEGDKLAIVVLMNITTGRCSLDPKGEAACLQVLSSTPCVEIDERNKHNALLDICTQLVPCKAGPVLE